MATAKKRKLGRGLKSMISAPVQVEPASESSGDVEPKPAGKSDGQGLQFLPLAQITPNQWQPRQTFDTEALAALAESIKSAGVMQPVLVRTTASGYELVAGERRLRAAEMAGLDHIPAVIRDSAGMGSRSSHEPSAVVVGIGGEHPARRSEPH